MHWEEFKAHRRAQLEKAGYALWVYKAHDPLSCPDSHAAFDEITLPPDHDFWKTWFPPHSAKCHCSAYGCARASIVPIMGGNLEKPLPKGWQHIDPTKGEGAF